MGATEFAVVTCRAGVLDRVTAGEVFGGMKGERPLPFLSFRLQKLDQGGPLRQVRSIPGLRERAGIERLAQGERPHVLFTRGCYPGKTLLALPKGNTAKF